MDEIEIRAIIRVLAKLTKSQYRELLAHRMLVRRLKDQELLDQEGYDMGALLESVRQSPELTTASAKYDEAIDSKIPPSDEESQDEALRKWLASLQINGPLN
jgi:hypothetical protein